MNGESPWDHTAAWVKAATVNYLEENRETEFQPRETLAEAPSFDLQIAGAEKSANIDKDSKHAKAGKIPR